MPLRKTRKQTISSNRSSKGPATEWEHVSITQPITTEPEPEFRTAASQPPPPPRPIPWGAAPHISDGCRQVSGEAGPPWAAQPLCWQVLIKLSQWREDSRFRRQSERVMGLRCNVDSAVLLVLQWLWNLPVCWVCGLGLQVKQRGPSGLHAECIGTSC